MAIIVFGILTFSAIRVVRQEKDIPPSKLALRVLVMTVTTIGGAIGTLLTVTMAIDTYQSFAHTKPPADGIMFQILSLPLGLISGAWLGDRGARKIFP